MAGGYPDDWQAWAYAVLAAIGAPGTDTNLASLWRWTQGEKPGGQPTQWNNPLNTTQDYSGGVSVNSARVKAYPDLQAGAAATAQTLSNGYYPDVLANLKASTPYPQWGAKAALQVRKWGTNNFANAINPGGAAAAAAPAAFADSSGGGSSSKNSISIFGSTIDLTGLLGMVQIGFGLAFIGGGLLILVISMFGGTVGGIAGRVVGATPQGRAVRAVAGSAQSSAPPSSSEPASPRLSEGAESEVAAARRGEGRRLSPEARAELTAAGRQRRRSA